MTFASARTRSITHFALCTSLALAGCGASESEATGGGTEAPLRVEFEVVNNQPSFAKSGDEGLSIQIPAQSFVGERAVVSITESEQSPVPERTLGKVYVIETTAALSASFRATVSFVVSPDVVASIGGASKLSVAHGANVGQRWDELLIGTYDPALGRYTVQTTSFSYFALIHEPAPAEIPDAGGETAVDAGPIDEPVATCASATRACGCSGNPQPGVQSCSVGIWSTCVCPIAPPACTEGATTACSCAGSSNPGVSTCTQGVMTACTCTEPGPATCSDLYDCEFGQACSAEGTCVETTTCSDDSICHYEFPGYCCDLELYTCVLIDGSGTNCAPPGQ